MIIAAFAFLGGVLALFALPAMPAIPLYIVAALTIVAGFIWRRYAAVCVLAYAGCGFLFVAGQAQLYLQRVWSAQFADERVLAQAVIESIPAARNDGWSFDARLRIEAPQPFNHELRARLISRVASVRPHAGERWRLLVKLRPPRTSFNPGAVDSERLLFHDRIHALGSVVASRLNERLGVSHDALDALRERVANHIEQRVVDRDAAALIAALAVGATGSMSREQWRVFNATGTTHLVAISGMHVTMFAVVMFAVARLLWSLFVWRWIGWPRDSFAAVVGLAAATAYVLLTGFSVPTQRTLIMLAAWLLARCTARESSPLQPLAIALLAVLLFDPFAPLATGFWLSFGAMGAILFVTRTRVVRRTRLREAIAVQLAVAAVLMPLTLACFGSISLLGPVVNAAAIPYISWLMVPVILLALALMPVWSWACDLALQLAEWLHNLAWPWLADAADSPLALAFANPSMWWYAVAAVGIAAALLPWPLRMRAAVMVCVLPLAAAHRDSPPEGGVDIAVLDVGEGTAIVVQTARHVLVYGTGESYGTEGSRAESVLTPFLRSRGVHAIDALIVGKLTPITGMGVTALFAAMPVRQTLIGGVVPDFAGARPCKAGEIWVWEKIRFRMLDHCAFDIEAAHGEAQINASTLQLTDGAAVRWVLVASGSERRGRERSENTSWRQSGARKMATDEVGAMHVTLDPKSGWASPEGLRSVRRAIWRAFPHIAGGSV